MIELYLDVGKQRQQEILNELKGKSEMSWTQLAKFLGVTKSMVSFYSKGHCKLPYVFLLKLCKLTKTNYKNYHLKLKKITNKPKVVKLPKMSEDFAEFLGIMYGDGCLSTKYSVVVSCDATSDRKYILKRVKPLFYILFGIKVALRQQNNCLHCRIYCKEIHIYLSSFGLPIGKKKNLMKIPNEILKNKQYSLAFIRGLFDTDGGFHRHHKKSAQINFTSYSKEFLNEVWQLLLRLGFNAKLGEKQIWILDKKEIINYFTKIGSNNFKNLYKYNEFMQTGIVPLHREIDYSKV